MELHGEKLLELGYCFRKTYSFEHLSGIKEAEATLGKLLKGMRPSLVFSGFRGGDHAVTIWDVVEREDEWDAFEAKHNIPDFENKNAQLLLNSRSKGASDVH